METFILEWLDYRESRRHPWRVIAVWILVIVASVLAVANMLAFEGEAEITRETEAQRARRLHARAYQTGDRTCPWDRGHTWC